MATAIDLGHRSSFRIGGAEIRPATCEVVGSGGRETIEPRVMQVLVALADARGQTVTRDDLTRLCWGGRVVGDDAINRVILKIRRVSQGTAAGAFTVKTIHKVGYRLFEAGADEAAPRGGDAENARLLSRRRLVPAALVVLLTALAAAFSFGPGRPDAQASTPASLAVLPFRNLSSGDAYFAQGVAEEIRSRLAREPQFRVAGGTSSGLFTDSTELDRVRRVLGVDYVLEGSVRSAGDRIRVDAALVQVDDGMLLWSERFDGSASDVFAIQERIGTSIAAALKRELVQPAPLRTTGDVYNLYVTARGLMRSRDPRRMPVALELLERAVAIDPGYAPAWSSLGQARTMAGTEDERVWAAARGEIMKALALAPDLAEAHGALAQNLLYGGAAAGRHIRRAAELDPNSAEIQYWLGHNLGNRLQFEDGVRAYRRAAELDPLWDRVNWIYVEAAWHLGDREQVVRHVERFARVAPPASGERLRGHLAFARGDFSAALIHFRAALGTTGDGDGATRYFHDGTLRLLGLGNARGYAGAPDPNEALRRGALPSIPELRERHRSQLAVHLNQDHIALAIKALLNAGQADVLAREYDGAVGLLGLSSRNAEPWPWVLVERGPLVALVLRAAGRGPEAERLLAAADRVIAGAMSRGRVPTRFRIAAAHVWAARGQKELALAALERAVADGWNYGDSAAFTDLAQEPAFRSLRGDPRFERVRKRIRDHLARERREVEASEVRAGYQRI